MDTEPTVFVSASPGPSAQLFVAAYEKQLGYATLAPAPVSV
jgi:hypothetical protein